MQDVTLLPYPSVSAIECADGKIYLADSNATGLMVLDSNYHAIDSLVLYPANMTLIQKSNNPDIKSITFLEGKILLVGSGSLRPYRNKGWLIDLSRHQKDSFRLDTFYNRLQYHGIEDLNIEGMTTIPNAVILSNRGNRIHRHNQLVFTSPSFYHDQANSLINTSFIGYTRDTTEFQGISGMDYSSKRDELIITVSTESSSDPAKKGLIGKSYIWVVKSISSKTRWKAINPDRIIDLENIDERFRKQKIESVCILNETKKFTYLLLCTENDEGKSALFRLALGN